MQAVMHISLHVERSGPRDRARNRLIRLGTRSRLLHASSRRFKLHIDCTSTSCTCMNSQVRVLICKGNTIDFVLALSLMFAFVMITHRLRT